MNRKPLKRSWFRKSPKKQKSRVLWRRGRVILKGRDMRDLRMMVYQRAGGRCEFLWDGKRCGKYAPWDGIGAGQLCYTVRRSRGGSDTEANTQWGCAECHKRRDHPGPQWGQAA